MKAKTKILEISYLIIMVFLFCSCVKDAYTPTQNNFVKKIKNGGYIVGQYTYTPENLISEVNSTLFYRKFYYDDSKKLIREEVAISPASLSSMAPSVSTHEFVDPTKTGITMSSVYEYDKNGNLARQLNYVPENGQFVFRSMRSFEYDNNNMISRILLHNSDSTVTQIYTFSYDNNGNVIEWNYLTYLFIPAGTGPKLLSSTTYQYDSYLNPYSVFKQSGYPGINTNRNNIIKTITHNYEPSPGISGFLESTTAYEYNTQTGYPVKVIGGEEFIYE
jgi:hypothetical protein